MSSSYLDKLFQNGYYNDLQLDKVKHHLNAGLNFLNNY